MSLADKIRDYRERAGSSSQRELALAERAIWDLVPASDRRTGGKPMGRGYWFVAALGGKRLDYEIRANLLTWGSAVDCLWARVEGDMGLNTAIELLRTAKKIPGELPEAVAQAVADYDALPMTCTSPGGKIVRKRAQARLPDIGDCLEGRTRERKTRVRAEARAKVRAESGQSGQTMWTELRGRLGTYIAERLVGLDPRIVDELYRDFERELNALLYEYQIKIDRTRARGAEATEVKVSRRLVVDACAVLAIDPPLPGKMADLVSARRQQRRLAKLYHPDTNMGDQSMRALYERVMQAYQRLDAYNASLAGRRTVATVVGASGEKKTEKVEGDSHGRGSQHGAQ